MSFLKKLFGGGSSEPKAPAVVDEDRYKDFHIAAAPMPEGGQYRLAATVTKTIDGEERVHRLIRADLFASQEEAAKFAIRKARQMIDEQGERIFG